MFGNALFFSPFNSPLLLDNLSADAAYSLRKLRINYNGFAIRVRRSSDNAETDIGFVNNELDTVTLLAFCGSGSGFVKTWYDQSVVNIRNAIQTVASNQPRIVNAGVLETINGKPSIFFDGADDIMASDLSAFWNTLQSSAFSVFVRKDAIAANRSIYGNRSTVTSGGRILRTTTSTILIANIGATSLSMNVTTPNIPIANYFWQDANTLNQKNNNSSVITSASTVYNVSDIVPYIGASGAITGEYFLGNISDVILFSSPLTNSERVAINLDQGNYYGIPV